MCESKWKTVSLPRELADSIQELIDECDYWPSLDSFVHVASLEKLEAFRRAKSSR